MWLSLKSKRLPRFKTPAALLIKFWASVNTSALWVYDMNLPEWSLKYNRIQMLVRLFVDKDRRARHQL